MFWKGLKVLGIRAYGVMGITSGALTFVWWMGGIGDLLVGGDWLKKKCTHLCGSGDGRFTDSHPG